MKHPAHRPAALLSAALLALLCACAPAGTAAPTPTPTPTPASAPDAAASAGPSAGAPLEQPVSTGFENLTQVSGSSYGSGSDEGFYELIARQDGSANLRYIDYASAREIYLCAAPNCTHDSESCPSWLADPACTPLVVGDRLLLFYPYPSATAGRPMQILKAGLDGSDRQTLIEFDASESCRSLVSANDHLLVMLVTRTDDTGADVEQGLVSVNLDTGERSSFYTVPEGMSPQFLGMTESGYCILYTVQETLPDEDFPDTEWSENRDKILSSRVHHWTAVPLGGGRGREIFQAAGDLQCMVADDGIYVFNVNTQELRRVTVPDGREETVAALPPQENWQPYSAVFDRKVGDWLLFSVSYYTDEINEETGNPHATDLSYAVNTVTGEQRQLQIQYDYYGSSRACTVLARTDTDLFLLTSNYGGDQMHYGFQYGIIPIQDYLDSNAAALRQVTVLTG